MMGFTLLKELQNKKQNPKRHQGTQVLHKEPLHIGYCLLFKKHKQKLMLLGIYK